MAVTKYTPKVRTALVAAVRAGNTLETAAHLCGVHPVTVLRWCYRDDDGDPDFAGLRSDLMRARAECFDECVRVVKAAALTEPEHAEWFLERRDPANYSRRNIVKVEVEKEIGMILDSVQPHMSLEAYSELVRALGIVSGAVSEDAILALESGTSEGEQ